MLRKHKWPNKLRMLMAVERELAANEPVFVYSLNDPWTDEVGYIGTSFDLRTRYQCHLRLAEGEGDEHFPRKRWIESLAELKLPPVMKILEKTTQRHRLTRERWWIMETCQRGRFNIYFEDWVLAFVVPSNEDAHRGFRHIGGRDSRYPFLKTKFYPVNVADKLIYNDPKERRDDCRRSSDKYRKLGVTGIRGSTLNTNDGYKTYEIVGAL